MELRYALTLFSLIMFRKIMGAYLSTPNTEKISHDESHDQLDFGVSGMQGWRMSMEVSALIM